MIKVKGCVLVIAFLCAFSSCTEVIEIEVPKFPTSPVINCFFTNDTVVKLRLSKTVNPLDSIPATISDARIWQVGLKVAPLSMFVFPVTIMEFVGKAVALPDIEKSP